MVASEIPRGLPDAQRMSAKVGSSHTDGSALACMRRGGTLCCIVIGVNGARVAVLDEEPKADDVVIDADGLPLSSAKRVIAHVE